jgi:uncharacterized RDD family membrane protein YckC
VEKGEMMKDKLNYIFIETPEGVRFPLILASPIARGLAIFIDTCCMLVIYNIAVKIISILKFIPTDFINAAFILTLFIVMTSYSILLEYYWNGATIGKKILRLKVIDASGLKLQFNQVLIRNILRIFDALPIFYLLGGVFALLSKRYQRLGDLLAQTLVIRIPSRTTSEIEEFSSSKHNSLRKHHFVVNKIRNKLTKEEIDLIVSALSRKDTLLPEVKIKLYGELANYLKEKFNIPLDATEGIADENILRNVLGVIIKDKYK